MTLPMLITGLVLSLPFHIFAQEISTAPSAQVTVNDVLTMSQAGISDDLMLAKIHQHNRSADLTVDQMLSLKKAHVSDSVIRALIDPISALPTAPATVIVQTPGMRNVRPSGATPGMDQVAVGDPNDPLSQHDSGIYVLTQKRDGNKMVMLERTAYQGSKTSGLFTSVMTWGIAKMKVKAVIPGKQATLRVSEAMPVFYFYFDDKAASLGASSFGGQNISNPNQFALVHLNIEKFTRSTEIESFGIGGGSSGSNEKSVVGYKSERLRAGLYKITLNDPMKAGEYCFIAASGAAAAVNPYATGAASAHELFDFGVDTL